MKTITLFTTLLCVALTTIFYSCEKDHSDSTKTSAVPQNDRLNFTFDAFSPPTSNTQPDKHGRTSSPRQFKKSTCGALMYGNHTGTGFYTYPIDTLDLTNVPVNATVSVTVNANMIPNRFSIYSISTVALLATSGWIGSANYAGPWGPSINTAVTGTLTFTRGSGALYELRVETVYPPGGGQEDAWHSSLKCHFTGCSGNPCTCTCSCP